jgi:hypothetical protein
MEKILITEPTLINYGNDRGGVHHDAGELPDVPKETALALVRHGRALFVNRNDDPDKAGANTAPAELLKAAKDVATARAKSPPADPKSPPAE